MNAKQAIELAFGKVHEPITKEKVYELVNELVDYGLTDRSWKPETIFRTLRSLVQSRKIKKRGDKYVYSKEPDERQARLTKWIQ